MSLETWGTFLLTNKSENFKTWTNGTENFWDAVQPRKKSHIFDGYPKNAEHRLQTLKTQGAIHYAKESGYFGRNSNGEVRFGFFRPKYSGSPLEVVHLFRLEYSDRNPPFHFWQTGSFFFFRIKSGKSHTYWLAQFNQKMSFHFRWVFPLISDRSAWHNGKHPQTSKHRPRKRRPWKESIVCVLDWEAPFFYKSVGQRRF